MANTTHKAKRLEYGWHYRGYDIIRNDNLRGWAGHYRIGSLQNGEQFVSLKEAKSWVDEKLDAPEPVILRDVCRDKFVFVVKCTRACEPFGKLLQHRNVFLFERAHSGQEQPTIYALLHKDYGLDEAVRTLENDTNVEFLHVEQPHMLGVLVQNIPKPRQ